MMTLILRCKCRFPGFVIVFFDYFFAYTENNSNSNTCKPDGCSSHAEHRQWLSRHRKKIYRNRHVYHRLEDKRKAAPDGEQRCKCPRAHPHKTYHSEK